MKVVSYYEKAAPHEHFRFWDDGIGVGLPKKINSDAILIEKNPDSNGIYKAEILDADITYCQLYHIPHERPKGFVYAFLSDFINNEHLVYSWLDRVRPNLLCCLQHAPKELIEYGKRVGCVVKLIPWFVLNIPEYVEKTVKAFCSGCVTGAYPRRRHIAEYLSSRNLGIVSCSDVFGSYKLSNSEYIDTMKKTKYYCSGGIYDRLVPPKYFEAAGHGATVVTFDMEYLGRVGFRDKDNCIVINNIQQLDEILDSEMYIDIGKRAVEFIRLNHTVEIRKRQLVEEYNAFRKNSDGDGSPRR